MTQTALRPTVMTARPAFEGANIQTWIGFKHFMYLVEHSLLQWLRDQGAAARTLYVEHGLGFEIVDCSVQLPAVIELDDEVHAQVTTERPDRSDRLVVRLVVRRDGGEVTVLRGKVTVALIREAAAGQHRPAPTALSTLEVPSLEAAVRGAPPARPIAPGQSVAAIVAGAANEFLWSWRAPYFYCHYSDRVQHSGFVRALEEVVDRFLADRGISVGRMLADRSWIPVVSRARVQLLAATHMEETVHTVFAVTDILRGVMFDGRMDCYVERGGALVPVATAQILHGYAIAAGPGAGGLAQLDDDVIRALTGGQR